MWVDDARVPVAHSAAGLFAALATGPTPLGPPESGEVLAPAEFWRRYDAGEFGEAGVAGEE